MSVAMIFGLISIRSSDGEPTFDGIQPKESPLPLSLR